MWPAVGLLDPLRLSDLERDGFLRKAFADGFTATVLSDDFAIGFDFHLKGTLDVLLAGVTELDGHTTLNQVSHFLDGLGTELSSRQVAVGALDIGDIYGVIHGNG